MTKRNVRRRNRKIKFSESDYIEKYYMVDGKAVIPIELKNIDDLYMEHDYKKMELSDSVCEYIDEIAYMFPVHTDIILEIHCPKCDEETQERIKKSIKNNYGIEIDDVEYDINLLNLRSIILILFGLLLLVINVTLNKYLNEVIAQILSVIWWIGIWDSVEIQLLDKTENKWKRLNYQQLYESEITFVFEENKKDF